VVTISSSGAADAFDGPARADIESASAAIPLKPGATAQDESTRYRRVNARNVRADSVATATSNCDGCSASSATLQIVYARYARTLTADNVATAWSTCKNCSSSAVSLQVVVVRPGGTITAANRSTAVNVACVGCKTNAAAIQIVILAPSRHDPSQSALVRCQGLRDELLAELHAAQPQSRARSAVPASPGGQAAPTTGPVPPAMVSTTQQIQSILASDLGATSARHDIQLRTQ
jgi:hypothetical protein